MSRSNFNVQKSSSRFLDEVFCGTCGTRLGTKEHFCGKCDREFSWEAIEKAIRKQAELREKNKRNAKYKPPALYI